MAKFCYLNGKIIPETQAAISVTDIGILRGYGVFEVMRTYQGKPFLFKAHWARLFESARILNLKVPVSAKKALDIISQLFNKSNLCEVVVRIVLTGGQCTDTMGVRYNKNKPTFLILLSAATELPAIIYQKGIALKTFEHQRELSSIKSINYLTAVKLRNSKENLGAFEILYVFKGLALEATTSNFFIFKGNRLITAKDKVLSGTTRNFVIGLAKNRFKVEQRPVKLSELKTADEAFITATGKEIIPVVRIDNFRIGDGAVGANTKILMQMYREHIKRLRIAN
jgi:branched-subunit amino acid aminotransferase/4-amino-4-deoxychorismate lyase